MDLIPLILTGIGVVVSLIALAVTRHYYKKTEENRKVVESWLTAKEKNL